MKKIHLFLILQCLLLTGCSRLPEADPGQAPDSGPPAVQESATPSGTGEAPSDTMQEDARTEEAPPESPPAEDSPQDPDAEALASLADDILTPSMTEYEKVRAIHDYLVVHVDYDYDNLAADTLPDTAFTKEGALLLHSAVCEGYARAFSWLCRSEEHTSELQSQR